MDEFKLRVTSVRELGDEQGILPYALAAPSAVDEERLEQCVPYGVYHTYVIPVLDPVFLSTKATASAVAAVDVLEKL